MPLKSHTEKTEFRLGLHKPRIAFLNSLTDFVFRIFSLSLTYSLTIYGKRDDSVILVLAEKVFVLFWFTDLV